MKERQPSLVAYSKKRSMVDVSIKQSWGIVIHLNLFWISNIRQFDLDLIMIYELSQQQIQWNNMLMLRANIHFYKTKIGAQTENTVI